MAERIVPMVTQRADEPEEATMTHLVLADFQPSRLQFGKELRPPDPVCAFVVSSGRNSTAGRKIS